MKKLLIYVVPVALAAAHLSAAPSFGWGGIGAFDLAAGIGAGKDAPLVLVQRRGGGGGVDRGGGGGANRGGGTVNRPRNRLRSRVGLRSPVRSASSVNPRA